MIINKTEQKRDICAVKLTVEEDGKVLGRAYLYLIYNDLHEKPYGFLEDVFVSEEARSKGLGTRLVKEIIEEAKKRGCYKLIATTRYAKKNVHDWYTKIGFKDFGTEFRMDF